MEYKLFIDEQYTVRRVSVATISVPEGVDGNVLGCILDNAARVADTYEDISEMLKRNGIAFIREPVWGDAKESERGFLITGCIKN